MQEGISLSFLCSIPVHRAHSGTGTLHVGLGIRH